MIIIPNMLDKSYDYYSQIFTNRGYDPPTQKAFDYVKHYLQHGDRKAAWDFAGLASIDHRPKTVQSIYLGNYHRQKQIQALFRIASREWAEDIEFDARSFCAKVLKAYDNATNIRDQLEALKLLAEVTGLRKPSKTQSKDRSNHSRRSSRC